MHRSLSILFGILALAGLYLCKLHGYLLFHSLVEIFSIAIACGIFIVAWNTRRILDNNYLLFLGVAFLFVAGVDLLHTLAYKGMGVFPGHVTNLPTQLWIAARYMQAVSLLMAPLWLGRRLKVYGVLLAYGGATAMLLLAIFGGRFPACYVDPAGPLTTFKIVSEYIICLILGGAAAAMYTRRRHFAPDVLRLLIAFFVVTIASELAFTRYRDPYGLGNLVGHFLKVVAFYLVYKAIIETGLTRPYSLLFRDLKRSEEALREDVAQRQRAEQALRDRNERLRLLSETASTLLNTENPRHIIGGVFKGLSAYFGLEVYANYLLSADGKTLRLDSSAGLDEEQVARLERLPVGEGVNGWVAEHRQPIIGEDVQNTTDERLGRTRMLGVTAYACYPLVAQEGLIGTVAFASRRRLRFDADELSLIQAVGHQIAVAMDRARLAEELRQRAEELAAANRAKDEFLATASHELRTPLTAMLGWARLLRSGPMDAQTLAEGLETIDRNAQAQAALVEDILDISRIISGRLRLNVRPTELAAVIQAAVNTVRPAADARGIRLAVSLDAEASLVNGDPDRLQQVVWNLVSNAIKFTDKGGQVQIALERDHSRARIRVCDTGKGISAEFLPHVFERFRQADTTSTRRHGGLGLGLAIVRHLVELHGGTVAADSPGEGQGSTFTVHLPVAAVRAAAATEVNTRPLASTPATFDARPVLSGLHVLVVDDEVDARRLIGRVLEQCGAQVTVAGSVAEAMAILSNGHGRKIDVLLSDIGMPGEDGHSLIRQVRAMESRHGGLLPAAALTAYARLQDRMQALSAGFQMYVPKPVEPDELVEVVANLAGRNVPRTPAGEAAECS